MPDYLVEFTGDVREVYSVTAESAEAAKNVPIEDMHLVISESNGMEFYSVREDD